MKIRKRRHQSGNITWQVDLGVVAGKRVQIACKTRDEAAALLEERQDERKRLGAAASAIPDAERTRFAAARGRLAAAGATIDDAVEFFLRHARPRDAGMTFGVLARDCIADKRAAGRSDKYCQSLRCLTKNFGADGLADLPAHLITTEQVAAYIQGNGWSAKTCNVYLTDLASIFAWGIEKKYLALNPCAGVTRPRVDESPPTIFSPAECERLLAAALDTAEEDNLGLLPYVAICLFAGVRMEECEQLTWDNVNLREHFIEIPAAVAKRVRGVRRRIIGMSANLAAWLKRSPRQEGPIPPPGIQKRMCKLRAAAKLATWPNRVLRHSFASYHLAEHRDAERTRLDMGHHDMSLLFSTYRELVRPKEAAAFWRLAPPALRRSRK